MTEVTDLPLPEPMPVTPTERGDLRGAIWALGFDPKLVQAVIVTPSHAVALAADYPEPYSLPAAQEIL